MTTPAIDTPISFKHKRWLLPGQSPLAPAPDIKAIAFLAAELDILPILAALLVNRGLADPAAAKAFLNPQFKTIHDPSLLPGIPAAVARLAQALANKEKIVLFGDYDVDGITGTAILWHTLKAAGAIPNQTLFTYTPHRVEEGYGMSVAAVQQLIDQGAQLIISIDCGITAHEPIALARSKNVAVIITDHHDFPPEDQGLPNATAIVHPRVPLETGNSKLETSYPNPDLCGGAVAYKLAWALATHLCNSQRVSAVYRDLLIDFTALVALATIADVVPLLAENRTLVKYGLQQLPRCHIPGVRALMTAAGYGPESSRSAAKVDCTAVGFSLAPRLNAAGRMDHADLAVELFTSADPARAAEIAAYLEDQNRSRQSTEQDMLTNAKAQIDSWLAAGQELPHVIVVHAESHHAGVVGIVASRLVDQFHRPTFVLACNDTHCHGSARSIPGFDLHGAIEHCRPLLLSGGGHAMAGGIKFARENLELFRQRINAYAAALLTPELLTPSTLVDGILTLADATVPLISCLQQFEPFGRGNPHPRFLLERVRLTAPPRPVGSTGAHLQLSFAQKNIYARGIAFKAGPLAPSLRVGMELDLLVEPRIDHFTGQPKVDFIIADLARSDGQAFESP